MWGLDKSSECLGELNYYISDLSHFTFHFNTLLLHNKTFVIFTFGLLLVGNSHWLLDSSFPSPSLTLYNLLEQQKRNAE